MTVTAPAPRAVGGGLDANEVVVAGFQRVLVAPAGTEPPDDIDEDADDPWVDLGYTTEDGIAFSFGLDTDTLMTSQTLDPVRMLTTARPKTITTPLRQWNRDTLTLAMGGGAFTGDDATGWVFTPAPSSFIDVRALLVEIEDGDKKARFVGYRTMVSEAVEFSAVNTDGLVFPLTFSVLANEPVTYIWQMNAAMLGAAAGAGGAVTPSLTAVSPDTGDPGDTVGLTGANFLAGMTVAFASAAATDVSVTSATAATCTVPAGTEGDTVAVTVTNPGGRTATLPDAFTYNTAAARAARRR